LKKESVMRAKVTLEAKMDRWRMNNSVPVIQHRILQLLGAADGQRLKRSQLTLKLYGLGCSHYENRIEALRQLEAVGKIRRETYQVREGSVQRGEIWVLVCPEDNTPPTSAQSPQNEARQNTQL